MNLRRPEGILYCQTSVVFEVQQVLRKAVEMDEGDGGFSFDFEGGIDAGPRQAVIQSEPAENNQSPERSSGSVRRSFRQTVCRHWLRSLCRRGDACAFLHQHDKSRMPVCRFFRLYGECRQQGCMFKHMTEDMKECNMYSLGFCPNGPYCRYRHTKKPGPPPPVEEVLRKLQQSGSYYYGNSNRIFQNCYTNSSQQVDRSQYLPGSSGTNVAVKTGMMDSSIVLQQRQVQQSQLLGSHMHNFSYCRQGLSRYFVVKSFSRKNLIMSVQQGVWATQQSNEAKLNGAFESANNVILIFSVNKSQHFQGCAKMTSRTVGSVSGGSWKNAHYGPNFAVKWMKLGEFSFHKTRHMRNPYNENLPVKISRDCQELESSVGEQLVRLLYLQPDSDLMAILLASESKQEEEGEVKAGKGDGNPDVMTFEDNEEEAEEEENENAEDGRHRMVLGGPSPGRGRGTMWPPQMPFARDGRSVFPRLMQLYPVNMMHVDGYGYRAVNPNSRFLMSDPFGMDSLGLVPYGPRFFGEFAGPGSGMETMLPTPGFAKMMMGPAGRAPFMTPEVRTVPAQARRHPFYPTQPPQRGKIDEKAATSDRNKGEDKEGSGDKESKKHQLSGSEHDEHTSDESESEDEAPRRSRYGEEKRRRRQQREERPL